jgi:FkbM family methyltransferase
MYSQNQEEAFVADYFKDEVGVFLELGANDGMTFSNTYNLLQKGWRGTLVECSPKALEKLKENMEPFKHQVYLIDVAISVYDGSTTFYESGTLLNNGDTSLVSSLKESELQRWNSLKIPFEKIEVQTLTFNSMLSRSIHKKFDLVSIDIEGMERFVIPQIDFKKLGTRMVIIEFNGKDEKFFNEYMKMFNFYQLHKNQENLIYAIIPNQ